jgi:sugar lactone lactonase YvrE
MPERLTARPFFRPPTAELRHLPECPRQLRDGTLGWIAIQHGPDAREGSFNVLDLATLENRTYPLPGRPGFFVETAEPDVLLIGLERRLVLFDRRSASVTRTLAELPEDPRVIINDGIAVPDGVIFGTKHLLFNRPIAALYHYGSELRELIGGQTCSNGKYFHDGLLIDVDTQPKTITEYRYRSDGPLEKLRLIVAPERLPSLPDGLRATPDGECIVVAFYNPAMVADGVVQQIRIADGEVLAEWSVPGSPRVTCPAWVEMGGESKLVFTTAVEGMSPPSAEAGSLFVADVFRGPPGLRS